MADTDIHPFAIDIPQSDVDERSSREYAAPLEFVDDVAGRSAEVFEPILRRLLAVAGCDGPDDTGVRVDDGVVTSANPDAECGRQEARERAEFGAQATRTTGAVLERQDLPNEAERCIGVVGIGLAEFVHQATKGSDRRAVILLREPPDGAAAEETDDLEVIKDRLGVERLDVTPR
jgi:hypothetical protein